MKKFIEKVLCLQEFGTYGAIKGIIQGFFKPKNEWYGIETFKTIPSKKIDVICLIGGYPRITKDALEFAISHRNYWGRAPDLYCIGNKNRKGHVLNDSDLRYFGSTQTNMYEQMCIELGFPKSWVLKNAHVPTAETTEGDIAEIKQLISENGSFSLKKEINVAIFTGAGYSLRAALEMGMFLNNVKLFFHEATIPTMEERVFGSENPNVYWFDLITASVYHPLNVSSWGIKRLALPEAYRSSMNAIRMIVKDLAEAGYVFHLYPDNMLDLGIEPERIEKLKNARKIALTGSDYQDNSYFVSQHELWAMYKEKVMIDYLDAVKFEWEEKGIKPFESAEVRKSVNLPRVATAATLMAMG